MNGILPFLRTKLAEVLKAIAPLVAVVCVLQVTLVHAPLPQFLLFLVGSLLAVGGMLLLFAGIEHGSLPRGRFIGAELPRKGAVWLIVAVAASLGFVTTIAEPDVLILASQVESVSAGRFSAQGFAYVIASGVAVFAVAGLLRIVYGIAITKLLAVAFGLVIALSFVSAPQFIPLAYDAGSVTTGVLSTPVLLALALGVSSVLARRADTLDGFGLLGLASIGPIVVVLLMGWLG